MLIFSCQQCIKYLVYLACCIVRLTDRTHQQAADNPRALRRTESDMVADGMAFLMRSYEDQLVNPLRNLVTGDLARSLLIQVQVRCAVFSLLLFGCGVFSFC